MGCSTAGTTYITSSANIKSFIDAITYSSIDKHKPIELERNHHGDSSSTTTDDPYQRPISIEWWVEYASA